MRNNEDVADPSSGFFLSPPASKRNDISRSCQSDGDERFDCTPWHEVPRAAPRRAAPP